MSVQSEVRVSDEAKHAEMPTPERKAALDETGRIWNEAVAEAKRADVDQLIEEAVDDLDRPHPLTTGEIRRIVQRVVRSAVGAPRGQAEPEPGELIANVTCPACGVSLEIMHGDDEGEIGVLASPQQQRDTAK